MKCKICDSESVLIFSTKVLRKYTVSYFKCTSCGFVQTEKPYWLNESYENSINLSDTGLVLRNRRMTRIVTSLIFFFFDKKKKFIDYAGGYGLFTRMMRDVGFDFYWSDPYTKNELAKGFEMEKGERYHVATSFESFEHFDNPHDELKKIIEIADNIIISTELIPEPTPKVTEWWYYAPEHGQHIAFYSKKSFQILANQFGLYYYNLDNVHLLTKSKISFWGRLLFHFKYSKHVLYGISFIVGIFLKTKTFEDMAKLKINPITN